MACGDGVERTGTVVFLERKTEGRCKEKEQGKRNNVIFVLVHNEQRKMLWQWMDIQKKSGQSVTALPGSLHHKGFDKRALTEEPVLSTGTGGQDLAELQWPQVLAPGCYSWVKCPRAESRAQHHSAHNDSNQWKMSGRVAERGTLPPHPPPPKKLNGDQRYISLMGCGCCSPWVNHNCTLSTPLKWGDFPLEGWCCREGSWTCRAGTINFPPNLLCHANGMKTFSQKESLADKIAT